MLDTSENSTVTQSNPSLPSSKDDPFPQQSESTAAVVTGSMYGRLLPAAMGKSSKNENG